MKLEDFKNRFEDPLLSEMEYANRNQDRLFDGAKIVFGTLRKLSLTGNLKSVQSDLELLGDLSKPLDICRSLKSETLSYQLI